MQGQFEFYHYLKIFAGIVFSVLFLQSGFDKVIDFKGNRAWITSYFKESPLKNMGGMLFIVLMITELSAGICSFLGVIMLFTGKLDWMLQLGIALSSLALLFVFTGQRIAKDYTSAANTIAYLAAAMLAWFIVSK